MRQQLRPILIGFLAGALVAGLALGLWATFSLGAVQAEKTRLEAVVKKQSKRINSLSQDQSRLQTELADAAAEKDKGYDQTIGALMDATESAGIEALYALGLKALAEKDYPRAYFALAKVHEADPAYKGIKQQYPAAQKAYARHRQSELEALYHKGLDQQASQQFGQAKSSFQQVVAANPAYKDAKARLASVSRSLAVRAQASELQQKKQWLEATYKLALNQQALGRLGDASSSFEQIVAYAPQYKDAGKRLRAIRARLPKAPVAAAAKPQNASALNELCYSKGIEFAQCAKGGSNPNCAQPASLAPPQCKSHPEFARGIQTVFKQNANPAGMLPDSAPDDPGEGAGDPAPAINSESLKGFSDFLKDL